MATAKRPAAASAKTDALTLLKKDHREVSKLFREYKRLAKKDAPAREKSALVRKICDELTLHAQLEEELFYPVLRDAFKNELLVDEAAVEHAVVKDLIAQLESMKPSDALYDAKVIVLSDLVDHHVQEEQDEIFPKVRKARIDTKAMGEEIMARKEALMTPAGKRKAG